MKACDNQHVSSIKLSIQNIKKYILNNKLFRQLHPHRLSPNFSASLFIHVFLSFSLSPCIYIYHHHHIVLVARISLTLSRHSSLSFIALGRSSGQHPVSSHSCWMYVRAGRPAFARPCVGIHKSTSLMSSSLIWRSPVNFWGVFLIYIKNP